MSLRINTNVMAAVTRNHFTRNDTALENALRQLSSGLRINRASDDSAGLNMSERFRAQIRGTEMALSNSQDASNLLGTAEGALNETHAILQRMRELAVQAATDTLTVSDRASVKQEMDELSSEITRIGANTEFNTHKLLDGGSFAQLFTLQVGPNAGDIATIGLQDMRSTALGIGNSDFTVSNPALASAAIAAIDGAIERVSVQRSYLGAKMNMLSHRMSVLEVQHENHSRSENRIRDVDFGKAASELTRRQLLAQSALSMMAQANSQPQAVLGLLR